MISYRCLTSCYTRDGQAVKRSCCSNVVATHGSHDLPVSILVSSGGPGIHIRTTALGPRLSEAKTSTASRETLAKLSGTPLALTFPDTSLFIKVVKRVARKIDERLRSAATLITESW